MANPTETKGQRSMEGQVVLNPPDTMTGNATGVCLTFKSEIQLVIVSSTQQTKHSAWFPRVAESTSGRVVCEHHTRSAGHHLRADDTLSTTYSTFPFSHPASSPLPYYQHLLMVLDSADEQAVLHL
eukprot:m.41950 g.41950  ORF g.41950 m.41950 type:complete len:126 (+) comp10630_c0_seq1:332-709(+)